MKPASARPRVPADASVGGTPPAVADRWHTRTSERAVIVIALITKVIALLLWLTTSWHLTAIVLFFSAGGLVVYHLLAPGAGGVCRVATRFATERPEVWLTIDDGPDPVDTPQLLAALDAHHARATFFVVGRRAAQYPDLIREIVRRGHQIGYHTHTHPVGTFWLAGPQRVANELDAGLAVLRQLGVSPTLFRSPVGIKNLSLAAALKQRDLIYVAWTIRSGDCLAAHTSEPVERVLRRLKPGAIVLMHEGPSVGATIRVKAITEFLSRSAERGFKCVLPGVEQLR